MKSKIIAGALVFIVTFITIVWLSLPYENFVRMAADRYQQESKITLSYDHIESGPFKTKFVNLKVDKAPIGDVRIFYSPLSLITRSIRATSKGAVKGDIKLRSDNVTFDLNIHPDVVNLMTKKVSLEGLLTAKGTVNLKTLDGSATLYSDKTGVQTAMGMLYFEKIDIIVNSENHLITIEKLTSKDEMALDIEGTIKLNTKNIMNSMLDIEGTAEIIGAEKEITIKGTLLRAKPLIR